MPDADYRARVLAKICRAVVDGAGIGRGLLVNYRELPDAVAARMMPHFGIGCGEWESAAMQRAASRNAKAPGAAFADDRAAKQEEASEELRAQAERHIGGVYRALEALREG